MMCMVTVLIAGDICLRLQWFKCGKVRLDESRSAIKLNSVAVAPLLLDAASVQLKVFIPI